MVYSLLVVEDDLDLQTYMKDLLKENGYAVKTANDGATALNLIKKSEPHLVLLDLGLPNMTGESVCRQIKRDYPQISVIILTGKDSTRDIVEGLNLGADDYITKPFETDEVVARIRARLRAGTTADTKIQVSDLVLDKQTFEVRRGSQNIPLTPQEFKLLEYLMANKGRVLTRDMILNRIWFYSPDVETRVVDVYVGYLRKKIDSASPKKLIHSIRGFGYVLKD